MPEVGAKGGSIKIDNFALTMHQTCPAKFDLRMNEGWTSRRRSGALGFGSAIHEGIAVWHKTRDIAQALLAIDTKWPDAMPVDDWRTKEKCLTTMIEYSKHYPSETWKVIGMPDNPVIEVPFTLDFGMYLPCEDHASEDGGPESPTCCICDKPREALEYGGIYDMLIDFDGQIFVVDHKTTSMMGSGYFNQFKPNNQMTGYIWAASQLSGRPVKGAMINAIGMYKVGKTKFERQITSRSDEEIAEWKMNVYTECCNIQSHKLNGIWPMRTGACTLYGLCEYHSVHSLGHARERTKRLETDYIREHWDYEQRDG